jgi:enoyl-CoA hydratase/carnithine racemase
VGLGTIVGLLFLVLLVVPVLSHRVLDMRRTRALGDLQKKRGARVIAMIHRQETVGVLGVPFYRFIDIEDSEAVLRAIRLTDEATPIDLVLHTPGGLVLASEQIAYALKRHPAKVTVIVPHYAMSGGTLLALAADEILMDPAAVLGPVDPQLGDMPAASLVRVVEKKPIERLDDRTLVLADVAEKAVSAHEAGRPRSPDRAHGAKGRRFARGGARRRALHARRPHHGRRGAPTGAPGRDGAPRGGLRAHGALPPGRTEEAERSVRAAAAATAQPGAFAAHAAHVVPHLSLSNTQPGTQFWGFPGSRKGKSFQNRDTGGR